jgi:hypothetical protein
VVYDSLYTKQHKQTAMGDATNTAWPTNKAMAYERINKLGLEKDDAGQYQHDTATKFCENIKRKLAGMFNLLDKNNGMSKLMEEADNPINTINPLTHSQQVTFYATRKRRPTRKPRTARPTQSTSPKSTHTRTHKTRPID